MSEQSPSVGPIPGAIGDIHPSTPLQALDRSAFTANDGSSYPLSLVASAVGMSETFVKKVTGKKRELERRDVLALLDQDAYAETLVPRSRVLDYLDSRVLCTSHRPSRLLENSIQLVEGNSLDLIRELPAESVQTVVTSTPYWGMRIYRDSYAVAWADGEVSPYGHEQTPEGFVRHTTEVLDALATVLSRDGSIWWNVMDTFNTRTQIRGNAKEALVAMQGGDARGWHDHAARRYSAGHSYLKDGEQCLIPGRIAERASRLGLFVKAVITWSKTSTLPEPQGSRVSRNLEYILHISKQRTPYFEKGAYRTLPPQMGGRDSRYETDKLSDVWTFGTSAGRDGHGAQFPVALPARCVALSSRPGDLVLDPFVGSGNAGVAAVKLGRRFVGFDVSPEYLRLAEKRVAAATREGQQQVISEPEASCSTEGS